jgi:uncharacterized protein YfdQ (DUF2303 family)
MDKPDTNTEAGAVAALAIAANTAQIIDAGPSGQFLVTPDGVNAERIINYDAHGLIVEAPSRIAQTVLLQTTASLVDYVNRFKGEHTTLLADIAANSIMAAIDYHGPAAADHVGHLAKLTLPHSVEWDAWKSQDKKMGDQQSFARWLEENAADVEAPSGADLLEICRDIQAVRRADFRKVVRTSGEVERFEYTEATEAKTSGSVEVPTKFQLRIPVYFGEGTEVLFAFLRWKLNEGDLQLGYQLHRAEHVRQAVFQQIVLDVASRTGCPAVFGKLGT